MTPTYIVRETSYSARMGVSVQESQIYFVPSDVRERTLCSSGFSCLRAGNCMGRPICTGVASLNCQGICILEQVPSCPYHVNYGSHHVCDCPTRVELFVRYQV